MTTSTRKARHQVYRRMLETEQDPLTRIALSIGIYGRTEKPLVELTPTVLDVREIPAAAVPIDRLEMLDDSAIEVHLRPVGIEDSGIYADAPAPVRQPFREAMARAFR